MLSLRHDEVSGLFLCMFMLIFDEIVESTHGLWAEHYIFGLRWGHFEPTRYSIELSLIVDFNILLPSSLPSLLVLLLIVEPFLFILSCSLIVMVIGIRTELFFHRLFDDLSSLFKRRFLSPKAIFGA